MLGRVAYFLDWKKLGEDPRVEDFITQINLIQYWLIEEEYELYEPLQQLKKARVEDQLLRIQKHLLLTEIRNSIDVSTFLPVSVTSESYLIFHLLFSGKWENEDANMSLSVVDI